MQFHILCKTQDGTALTVTELTDKHVQQDDTTLQANEGIQAIKHVRTNFQCTNMDAMHPYKYINPKQYQLKKKNNKAIYIHHSTLMGNKHMLIS